MSARCIRDSTSRPWSGNIAMPTLARTSIVMPWKRNGSSIARASLPAITSAASTVVPSGSRTANSSPPTRATSSASGAQASSRGPISRRSRSPAWWPSVSLSSLKWSRSISSSASLVLRGAGGGRGLVEAGEQLAAVGEPGQRIVQRVVLALGGERAQLVLELAAVGRVAHVEHEALDARVVQAVGGDDVEVAVAAVAVREAQRQVAGDVGLAVGVGEVAVERGTVVRVDELVQRGCRRSRRARGRARRGSTPPASARAGRRRRS